MADNLLMRQANGTLTKTRSTELPNGAHVPHQVVRSLSNKFVDAFTGPLTDQWDITSSGSTAAVNAGLLTISSGVVAGSYIELLSKATFTLPFRIMAAVANTRHAANHQIIEMVSVDPETGIPDGKNSASIDIGGAASTTATQMKYSVQNGGLTPLESAVATITTTATSVLLEIEPFEDEAWFHSRVIDSTAGRSASFVRHQSLPDPNAVYKIRIRSMNHALWKNPTDAIAGTGGVIRLTIAAHAYTNNAVVWVEALNGVLNGTAEVRGNYTVTVVDANTIELQGTTFAGAYKPGSGRTALASVPTAVTMTMPFINVQDYEELKAEILGGRGQTSAGQGLGVTVIGTLATHPVTVTSGAITATSADNIFWNESVAALAAGATLTGTARDTGVAVATAHRYAKFNAMVLSNEPGTLAIDVSLDNVTWRRLKSVVVGANVAEILSVPVMARYHRSLFTNSGASATTTFMLNSSYTLS
ncbi:MAG: hypothetical protein EOR25_10800 [Mesorhizobium sp.]|uniref:hypothetical protein n=1 Tax=Mesorhizobium sp. TaxID=1871066 RepID=UPI000FE378CB|nr:hypothetical protein [Mesorhizobium sp.]RWH49605.1 MAG: hypothetical protein EOQ80_06770 [Mesorhizobium sp.]RWH52158.1 MAG: hypothetical protein EOQ82_27140 [Mesorhizobium sp.]RWI48411.1 MAG: hypothetical protein EOR15_13695 [Mesorhizobium sp.]RWI64060.1 MAG: hypothetical protein EOR18_30365 [Mesorhizobium sp.]RWI88162.1 MAG: hypothetical protein EOR20_03750 [Mesorhizobium sp.]